MSQAEALFEQAQKFHEKGLLKQAEPLYLSLLQAQPDHEDALFWLASLYTHQNRHQDAVSLYYRALDLNPNAIETHTGLGLALNALGQAAEAESRFRFALDLAPETPELHYYFGAALFSQAKFASAEAAFRDALRLRPDFEEARINLRETLLKQDKTDEAAKIERQMQEATERKRAALAAPKANLKAARVKPLPAKPVTAATYFNEGEQAFQASRYQQAVAAYQKAVSLDPNFMLAHYGLGTALMQANVLDEARVSLQKALTLKPTHENTLINLGNVLLRTGQNYEALDCFEKAIALNPKNGRHWLNLGAALIMLHRHPEAEAACRKALELAPTLTVAHMNLGISRMDQGDNEEAFFHCNKALTVQPSDLENLIFLATVHSRERRYHEAEAALYRLLAAHPNAPRAHAEIGMLRLMEGDFETGWPEYEWTYVVSGGANRTFNRPQWNGEMLPDAALLLHLDQGVGDCIQLARYLPLVKERVGRIILECRVGTAPLYVGHPSVSELVEAPCAIEYDAHISTTMLPGLFWRAAGAFGSAVPYLQANADRAEKWRQRFESEPGFKVGIVWAGSPTYPNDHLRSTTLDIFAPLKDVPNVRLYSLQKGDAAAQAIRPPDGLTLTDLSNELTDYGETAAVISCLDLVITVDTSVAHLAGALGKPVWTLIPFISEWRWQRDRTDTDWYPIMRLFRAETFNGWQKQLENVAQALDALVNKQTHG